MLFNTAIATVAGFLAVSPLALATITITGPSANAYWVQNTSNQITWEYNQGDPNPVSIVITNTNNTFLNGAFSIAEHVDLSNKSFTVTNVTLSQHPGYIVNFVNGSNQTQVYAQSGGFDVRAPGTPQVSQATPTGSSPSATGTSPAGNNGNSTGGAAGNSTGGNNNNAAHSAYSSVGSTVTVSLVFALFGAITTL